MFGDGVEGLALETGDEVFGDGEDLGVGGVVVLGGRHVCAAELSMERAKGTEKFIGREGFAGFGGRF